MTRHRLIIDDSPDVIIYGISCHLKDFRLAWNINRLMRFDLERARERIEWVTARERVAFDFFRHRDEVMNLSFVLLNNHCRDACLVRSHKSFDFFMAVSGYLPLFDAGHFSAGMQQIQQLQFLSLTEPDILDRYLPVLFEN